MNEQELKQLYLEDMQQPYFKLHYIPYEVWLKMKYPQQQQLKQRTSQDEVVSKILEDKRKQEKINKDAYYRSNALRLGNTVSSLGPINYQLETAKTYGNLKASGQGASAIMMTQLPNMFYTAPIPTAVSFLGGAAGQDAGDRFGTYLEENIDAPKYTSDILRTVGGFAGGLWGWKYGANADKQLYNWWQANRRPSNNNVVIPLELPAPQNATGITNKVVTPLALSNKGIINNYPGFQLKSLMKGNALEKQLSKVGTISVNSVLAHIKKASEFEQKLIKKVLDEKFKGQKNISYNELRQAVQDELIPYERTPQAKWSIYGMDKLGYQVEKIHDGAGGLVEYVPNVPTNTFTFNSYKIPKGNANHYSPNTLGHFRTFINPNNRSILNVLESQSDWAQHSIPVSLQMTMQNTKYDIKMLEKLLSKIQSGKIQDEFINEDNVLKLLKQRKKTYDDIQRKQQSYTPHENYLRENYMRKQLYEIIKYASENKHSKLRFPTEETAAKIEGFTKQSTLTLGEEEKAAFNEDIDMMLKVLYKSPPPISPISTVDNMYKIDNATGLTDIKVDQNGLPYRVPLGKGVPYQMIVNIPELFANIQKLDPVNYEENEVLYDQLRERYDRKRTELENSQKELTYNGPKMYTPQHQTILKKYSDFPKLFKKLYKNQEVRTVTDDKGNTWYEVDVPENFLQQEWQYRSGGKVKLIKRKM